MKRTATSGNISGKTWFDIECIEKRRVVCKALRKFNAVKSDSNSNEFRINYTEDGFSVISVSEVQAAIKALKDNKAAGSDGLSSEFFGYSAPCVLHFVTEYFNKLFNTGTVPSEWSESVILPIFKNGEVNSPNNYRGISLLNVGGKLYSYILNKPLTQWIEDNKMLNEAQADFRQGYSTIDHVFMLLALVQKQLLKHGKLYVCFIDFKKAFDLIDRNTLWLIRKIKWYQRQIRQSQVCIKLLRPEFE